MVQRRIRAALFALAYTACPQDQAPGTTDAPATTTTAEPDSTSSTTGATTDDTTEAPSSSGSTGPSGPLCGNDDLFPGSGQQCAADELCIEDNGGDTCTISAWACVPLPEGCTADDPCAPACVGLCDNYNCPITDFCDPDNAHICDYSCGSQASCRLPGTACKPITIEKTGLQLNHCVPTPDPAAQLGEPCTLQGDGLWTWDTCAPGTICWPIDPDTGEGTCRPQCGLKDSPPCEVCFDVVVVSRWVSLPIAVCTSTCDPLQPDCPPGDVCVPELYDPKSFFCMPDASDDGGALYDGCDEINGCDPGLACALLKIDPPACDPSLVGCCLPYCDTTAPACPDGLSCEPWYAPGKAPPGLEDLGLCVAP